MIGILLLEILRDRVEVGPRLFDRDAVFQTAEPAESRMITAFENIRIGAHIGQWRKNLRFSRELHFRWEHANDFCRHAVERDATTDDIRSAAKPFFPKLIADHGDVWRSRLIFGLGKVASNFRFQLEDRKQICRHACAADPFRFAFTLRGKIEPGAAIHGDVGAGTLRRAPIEIIWIRKRTGFEETQLSFAQQDETLRLRIGQRFEQD